MARMISPLPEEKKPGVWDWLTKALAPVPRSPLASDYDNTYKVMFKTPKPTMTTPQPPVVTPTPTPTPTPIPTSPPAQTLGKSYKNATYYFEPDLHNAISRIPDVNKRNLIFALAAQESSGGQNLYGDYSQGKPQSFGPFHINLAQRPEVTMQQAMDPVWATNYALSQLNYWIGQGLTPEQALRKWNWLSGYAGGTFPRYDVELPLLAETGTFLKKGG